MRLVEDQNKRLKFIINFLVLVISFITIARRDGVVHKTSTFENIMIDSFAPIQQGVVFVRGQVKDFFNNYLLNISASKENGALKKQLEELERQIFALEEVGKENIRIKDLLEFGDVRGHKRVLAQLVGWDSSSDFQVVRINKGLIHGVSLQAPVVTSNGLVGYIFRLTDNFADVLTILDSNNRVDGLIQRVRAHGIIEGYRGNRCLMKYVGRSEPVILNDQVLTSGLGNIYPKGIRIGYVSRIEKESFGITQEIEITPAVDFRSLEEVVILIADDDLQKQREWKALNESDQSTGN